MVDKRKIPKKFIDIKNRRCVPGLDIMKKVRRSVTKIYLFVYELSATSL